MKGNSASGDVGEYQKKKAKEKLGRMRIVIFIYFSYTKQNILILLIYLKK